MGISVLRHPRDFTPPYRIRSRAPTRIDLAGGTIDLWPLYLFVKNPLTLNLAIDLSAQAELVCRPAAQGQGRIQVGSADQAASLSLTWAELEGVAANPPPALALPLRLLQVFAARKRGEGPKAENTDLELRTEAKSPAGAGLGGSSTLSIALIGALASWAAGEPLDPARDGERFIEITRDVETTVIQVPAGLQDYYAAMFGGLQGLSWGVGSHSRRVLPETTADELERRILLFYSGQSRNSGINNWALFKGLIDGLPATRHADSVRERFQRIADATRALEGALDRRDWAGAGQAISMEWETRRQLAHGISTPAIDQALAEAGKLTTLSGKVCGAGGGGCFFVYADALASDDGQLRGRITEIFKRAGIQPLPYRASKSGLEVQIEAMPGNSKNA